jgi:hypothetical protein
VYALCEAVCGSLQARFQSLRDIARSADG